MDTDAELRRLLDEAAIIRVISQGFRAADRCDVEAIKKCYWPDATYWHIFTNGNAWECMERLMTMLAETTEAGAHNLGGNITIEINGDVAAVEAYSTNSLRVKLAEGGTTQVLITARNLDRFERRNGEWRIASRRILPAWHLNGEAMMGEEAAAEHFSGPRQGFDDPSYAFFAEIAKA